MHLIGLTGGIATGKSTVSRMFESLGVTVIDADQLARQVVEPGEPALEAIARRFPGVVGPDGRLDRKKLGERIFREPSERLALNAIVHPKVQEAFAARVRELEARGVAWAIYDVPLLFENGLQDSFDAIILVDVPEDTQLERLMLRDGLSREQAHSRLASQWPMSRKRAQARWRVDNSQSLEDTRRQVEDIYRSLSGHSPVDSSKP